MAAKIPVTAKKVAIESMVRTAELDDANIQHCIDYWTKTLGYGDVEWVKDLFGKRSK